MCVLFQINQNATYLLSLLFCSNSLPLRKLDGVVKLDMLRKESPTRIEEIWMESHEKNKNAISRVLTADQYRTFLRKGKERWVEQRLLFLIGSRRSAPGSICPCFFSSMFIFPVQRQGNYFVLLSQFQVDVTICAFHRSFSRVIDVFPWWCVSGKEYSHGSSR